MSDPPVNKGLQQLGSPLDSGGERLVYVLPEHALVGSAADEPIDLFALWDILWRGKWLVIVITVLSAAASVLYALSQEHWYRADVLLAPAEARAAPSFGGQLGGLAALAGISVGGGESIEAIAVLQSRSFARDFIEEFELLQVFFAEDWDEERSEWRIADRAEWPDVRDAVKFFHDNVLRIREDRETGLVTLSVEWTDPQAAAFWAMELTRRLNQRLRDLALLEAEANVQYLQSELAQTNLVTLQQSIGRLLEAELHKLMLARGNEEFAFRVIDAAEVPKKPSKPRRALIAAVGTLLGGILGVVAVLLHNRIRNHRSAST